MTADTTTARTPEALAAVLDEFAVNPKGGKMAAIAYKRCAAMIRDWLVPGAPSPAPAAPSAAQADALADEREFNGQLLAMLKKMFDAPTMAAGYAILADFAAQFYPGNPVALQPAQGGSVSEAATVDSLDEVTVTPRRPFDDDEPDGYQESDRDFVNNNHDACVWLLEHFDQIRAALSAARASAPAAPEVVEALIKAAENMLQAPDIADVPDADKNPETVDAERQLRKAVAALRTAGEGK